MKTAEYHRITVSQKVEGTSADHPAPPQRRVKYSRLGVLSANQHYLLTPEGPVAIQRESNRPDRWADRNLLKFI